MTIEFIKTNTTFNNSLERARKRRMLKAALESNNISIEDPTKPESGDSDDSDGFDPQMKNLFLSKLDVEPKGVSKSIEEAEKMLEVGIEEDRTAGEIARSIAKLNRTFPNDAARAFTKIGGSEGATAIAGATTLGAYYAGAENIAKGAFQATKLLSGPGGLPLNVIGPSEEGPHKDLMAMGSGGLSVISNKIMDMHYNVADKMNQGVAGYDQGLINGHLVSIAPSMFGGSSMWGGGGNLPSYITAKDISDALTKKRLLDDEQAIIGDDTDFNTFSPTQMGKEGIGYSESGAAPAGSQHSITNTFGSEHTEYDEDEYNFEKGGKVNMNEGGDPSQKAPTGEMGFVGGPPDQFTKQQTVADDVPKKVPDGTFIINAPAVEFAGKEDIKQMLIKAYELIAQAGTDAGLDKSPKAVKIPSKEQVDIMISRGEVIVPPEVAKVIGYDRLEKINNRGKKEVAKRSEEAETQSQPQSARDGGSFFSKTTPARDVFVPGVSDEPVPMKLDDMRFFGVYRFGDIRKAIQKTEIQGFEDNPFIFTGSKAKGGKGSSAFGPMQITYSLLKDFIDRSEEYPTLTNEQKEYVNSLLIQGEDKVNKELYGIIKRGPKDNRKSYTPFEIFGKDANNLKARGVGVIDPKIHKKYYGDVADAVLLHKLGDHKKIQDALASYGEGKEYSDKVYNDLLDLTQTGFLSKPVSSK